jgi:hypothetical protein
MVSRIKCNIKPQCVKVKTTSRVNDNTIKNSRLKMNINQESNKIVEDKGIDLKRE